MLEKLSRVKKVIGFLLGIVTAIKELVKIVEQEEPDDEQKRGEEKKKIVKELVLLIYDTVDEFVEDLPISREAIENFVDKAIDIIVMLFNALNVFR